MGESWSEFALSRSGGPYRIELRRGRRAVDAMTLDEGFEGCMPIMLEDGAQKVRVVVWVSIPPMVEDRCLVNSQ